MDRTRIISALLGALALAFVLLPAEGAGSASAPGEPGERVSAWNQSQQPPIQLPPGPREKPKHARLDSQLNELIELLATLPEDEVASRGAISQGSSVAVSIWLDPDAAPGIEQAVVARGGIVANKLEDVIEAYVPVRSLAALDVMPGVLFVRSIIPPEPLVTSQGTTVHNSPNWNASGFTGAGVKVGIIDTGFAGYSGLIGTELPSPAAVRCYIAVGVVTSNISDCESGGEVHGTAVAETVRDVAPGSTLYISDPISPGDLIASAQWMMSQGVKVINHSVGWRWALSAGDGTSIFSDSPLVAVDQAVSSGAVWVNSAGNEAQNTWTGPFLDSDSDGWMQFSWPYDDNAVGLSAGESVVVEMRWDDAWKSAARDLDLALVDPSGSTVVAASTDEQSGSPGQIPYERLVYTAPSSGYYYVAVHQFGGVDPSRVQVHVFSGQPLEFAVAAGSIAVPADSANPGMLAVGAAAWDSPGTIEPFSSQGPTADGRIKPDIVGADMADTFTYGPSGFPGTSQASPHVAGLAALVRQRFPTYTPTQTASYLKGNALPRGPAGADNTWGYGFAYLPPLATKLGFTATPTGGLAGVAFPIQPKVAAQNDSGVTMTTDIVRSVVLSKASGPGALTCTGGLIEHTVNGVATFSGCSVSAPGVYTLRAVASGLTSATSASFTVDGATKLGFIATPTGGVVGVPFPTQPKVAAQNSSGVTMTTDMVRSVVLSRASGPGTLSCIGGLIKNTVNGVATFSGCSVSAPGVYTLRATASGLTGVTSTSFTIYAVPVIHSLDPPNTIAGGPSFVLNVNGANFVSGSVIQFNGANRATAVVDGEHLWTSVSAAEIVSPGPIFVTVVTPGVGTSNVVVFLVYDTWSTVPSVSRN